jgi:(p)ppGpp synthase/HD superfamily hydrolase
MNTELIAQSIVDSVAFAKHAHVDSPISPDDAVRFHDLSTPYIVHPIWCAMTILTETMLEESGRLNGYLALMWHDVLEDTHAQLPDDVSDEVRELIQGMTFASFALEKETVWQRPSIIRLLKLYDKTSNLLDGSHMSKEKWNTYVQFTQALIADVANNFGSLNIVKIAKSIAVHKP